LNHRGGLDTFVADWIYLQPQVRGVQPQLDAGVVDSEDAAAPLPVRAAKVENCWVARLLPHCGQAGFPLRESVKRS
jgi:hypothetical protein